MEETRQHSALDREQFAIGLVHIAGLLAFLVGVILQFVVDGRALQIGLLIFVCSRLLICFWQVARPPPDGLRRFRLMALVGIVLWIGLGYVISMPFWKNS